VALYAAAGVDTAADSTVAARALYGAVITYENYLDQPDSAEIYRQTLLELYPDSPQAFEARSGRGTDLFGYLLAQRAVVQAANYENLSDEEREALETEVDLTTGLGTFGKTSTVGVRRRMIYLARRDNIVFEPTAEAVAGAERRQAKALEQLQEEIRLQGAATDTLEATPAGVLEGGPAAAEQTPEGDAAEAARLKAEEEAKKKAEEEAAKKAAEEKKKKEENWDFLR
jgi:hypothetical protein